MNSLRQKILFAILFLMSANAFALTPPLAPEELLQRSDLVVEGVAQSPVRCLKRVDSNQCADIYRYQIPVKVSKVIKGTAKSGDLVPVTFQRWDYSKSKCVGDQGPNLLPDTGGTFYLKQGPEGTFDAFHWSAVKATQPGNGSLPLCR